MYKDENDYEIQPTLDFKECKEYKSSVNFKIDTNFDEYDENDIEQFKLIKYKIYTEGPLLAALQSNKNKVIFKQIILIFIFLNIYLFIKIFI